MSYKSEAQREKFKELLSKGKISQKTVDEFDAASKGKKLPSRLKAKVKTPRQKLNKSKGFKFKVGDKVRRINCEFGIARVGHEYIIQEIKAARRIGLEGDPGTIYDATNFELVATASPAASLTPIGKIGDTWDINTNSWSPQPGAIYKAADNDDGVTWITKEEMELVRSNFKAGVQGAKRGLGCDCGGFKTFGTMVPEAHSHWCSSQGQKI